MVEQLKEFVLSKELQNKAVEKFWVAFDNWKKKHPKKYMKEFVDNPILDSDIFIQEIGLRSYDWPECNSNLVRVTLFIGRGSTSVCCYYSCYFSLDGDFANETLKVCRTFYDRYDLEEEECNG